MRRDLLEGEQIMGLVWCCTKWISKRSDLLRCDSGVCIGKLVHRQDTFFAHSDSIVGVFKDLTTDASLETPVLTERFKKWTGTLQNSKIAVCFTRIGKSKDGHQYIRVGLCVLNFLKIYVQPGSISSNIRDSKPSSWTAGFGDWRGRERIKRVDRHHVEIQHGYPK